MKVMIVNLFFAPESFGGATLVAEESAVQLAQLGHEVVVVAGNRVPNLHVGAIRRYEALGLPVVSMRMDFLDDYDNTFHAETFSSILKSVRPDVVHFHAVQTFGVGVVEAAQELGIPTVVTLHDAWWLCERQFMIRSDLTFCGQHAIDPDVCATCVADPVTPGRRRDRSLAVLNGCDRVLVPSAHWRRLMAASGVADDILFVNSNGVQRPAPGWQRTARTGPVRLGFVGGQSPIKGHPEVVAALQSLDRSDYVLKVVDPADKLGQARTQDSHWDVPGQVEILPSYDRNTIDEFFDDIDVLLFPTKANESYGLTVREAAVRGVWPIVADGGALVEDLTDGLNATFIPFGAGYQPLAKAIAEVLDAPEKLDSLTGADLDITTVERQAAELQEHYEAIRR